MEESISKQISRISKNDWEKLLSLIPKIENAKDFGKLMGGERISENCSALPYVQPTRIANEFMQLAYDQNFVLKFDWMNWKEG